MLALSELQSAWRRALLEEDEAALRALDLEIAGGDLIVRERLKVYRSNVFGSLTDVLRDAFPVVCRLVGDHFFGFAAHDFIVAHPPSRPVLAEYGDAFPAFLATFPACRDLVYLADTARFEWLMNVAANAAARKPGSPERFIGAAPEDAVQLTFAFHPSYGYLASPWPIDRIWQANQPDAQDQSVNLDAGSVRLEVSRQRGSVVFRHLDEATFVFRRSLSQGAVLGAALENAVEVAADFAAADAITMLFQENAVIAVARSSSKEEDASRSS